MRARLALAGLAAVVAGCVTVPQAPSNAAPPLDISASVAAWRGPVPPIQSVEPPAFSPYSVIRVWGQVPKPGWVMLPPGGTLGVLKLLQAAGGPTTLAARQVIVFRPAPDGKVTMQTVALAPILRREQPDFLLAAGDEVFVPEASGARPVK